MSLFKKIFFAVLAFQVGCGATSPKTMQAGTYGERVVVVVRAEARLSAPNT